MNNFTIILAGIVTIALALWWYKRIQKSRESDPDFKRRHKAKEELGKDESTF